MDDLTEVTDPVCGMTFPEEGAEELGALHAEHEGKRVWFCSPTCEREFLADPSRYLQRKDHVH